MLPRGLPYVRHGKCERAVTSCHACHCGCSFADGLPGAANSTKAALGMPIVWQMSERRPGSSSDRERDIVLGRPLVGVDVTTLQAQTG